MKIMQLKINSLHYCKQALQNFFLLWFFPHVVLVKTLVTIFAHVFSNESYFEAHKFFQSFKYINSRIAFVDPEVMPIGTLIGLQHLEECLRSSMITAESFWFLMTWLPLTRPCTPREPAWPSSSTTQASPAGIGCSSRVSMVWGILSLLSLLYMLVNLQMERGSFTYKELKLQSNTW